MLSPNGKNASEPSETPSNVASQAFFSSFVRGSGGREHALIKKLLESPKCTKLYCAPGNGGISRDAELVNIGVMDKENMVKFAKDNAIDLVFVAPDDPLADGMVDAMQEAGIRAFGPNANAAIIEASKVFSKNLMKKYGFGLIVPIPPVLRPSSLSKARLWSFELTIGFTHLPSEKAR